MESKMTGNRYVLAVNNLAESTDFYKSKLGSRLYGHKTAGTF